MTDDTDAEAIVRALVKRGHAATKVASFGGFLDRRGTTLFCGIPAADLDDVLELIRKLCPPRRDRLPAENLPLAGEIPYTTDEMEVRVAGAVVFVLTIEHFERIGA